VAFLLSANKHKKTTPSGGAQHIFNFNLKHIPPPPNGAGGTILRCL
jgi:hypothetical protein